VTVSPGTRYLHNWHIDAIVHQLMRVHTGQSARRTRLGGFGGGRVDLPDLGRRRRHSTRFATERGTRKPRFRILPNLAEIELQNNRPLEAPSSEAAKIPVIKSASERKSRATTDTRQVGRPRGRPKSSAAEIRVANEQCADSPRIFVRRATRRGDGNSAEPSLCAAGFDRRPQ